MHFIIVGAGLGGLAAAWWARHHGHQATIVERCATVAERASHALSGLALPTALDPWFGPVVHAEPRAAWPWQRAKLSEALEAQRRDAAIRLAGWAARAQHVVSALAEEASGAAQPTLARPAASTGARTPPAEGLAAGLLYLFDDPDDWARARAVGEWLSREAASQAALCAPAWLEADACLQLDPSLAERRGLLGAASFPQASMGNPAWLAKLLRHRLERDGVRFLFGREAVQVRGAARDVEVVTQPARAGAYDGVVAHGFVDPFARTRQGAAEQEALRADRVIVAGGSDGLALLAASSLAPPAREIATVQQAALTGPVGDEGHAPRLAIVDAGKRVSVTRLDRRVRVWGAALDKRAPAPEARIDRAVHEAPGNTMRLGRATRWQATACLGSDGLPAAPAGADARVRVLLAGASLGFALPFGVAAALIEEMVA
ncbi:FAD-dependent oxidoreductase [Chitinasiproducens palmae]|uniref:FAD dependent oxidoreductase n=1 Tax=Chitinasiproducens palmae TaxID=1770053 RepID=A0A1H2PXT8_9BURK|nr:FAD-dependent oxidoreductase [Chitinasiproducens palmae]SDV51466.1 FAD dependent oxidoreductase [Chitinasiproducens palmae]